MNDSKKKYRVTRFCCTSGMCLVCRAWAKGTERKRIVHAENQNKIMAQMMVDGWQRYGALAEVMK